MGNNTKLLKKIINNRRAKTSKTLLPCRRRALLAETAGFKKIPEYIQTKHEDYTKSDLKNILKNIQNPSLKKEWKSFQTIIEKNANLAI